MGIEQQVTTARQPSSRLNSKQERQLKSPIVQTTMNAIFDYVWVLSSSGQVMDLNDKALFAGGVASKHIEGQHLTETPYWSYSASRQHELAEALQQARWGEKLHYRTKMRVKSKRFAIVDVFISPIKDEYGAVTQVVVSAIDKTPRDSQAHEIFQLTERHFRQIVQHLPQSAVLVFNNEMRFQMAEGRELASLGYLHGQMIGRTLVEVLPTAEFEATETDYRRALNGETFSRERKTKTGAFELHYAPIHNDEGEVIGGICIADNVTERQDAERYRFDALESKDRMKILRKLTQMTADDFKTPLSIMNASLYLLERFQDDPEKSAEQIDRLHSQVDYLTRLYASVLTLVELDTIPYLAQERFQASSLIQHLTTELQKKIQEKSLTIEVDLAQDIPTIIGDYGYLIVALRHLMANAIDYTPDGGSIRLRVDATYEGEIAIAVDDNGRGISEAVLPFIFTPYYRAEGENQERGHGLGLSIVQKIVERHGGQVFVDSELGEGSTFTMTLPIRAVD